VPDWQQAGRRQRVAHQRAAWTLDFNAEQVAFTPGLALGRSGLTCDYVAVNSLPRLIPASLDDTELMIQVLDVPSDRDEYAPTDVADIVADFRRVTDAISAVSADIVSALQTDHVSEISAEFGIGVTIKSSKLIAVLVDASANAAIKVTVNWKRSNAPHIPA
jgi:hypothetical protein